MASQSEIAKMLNITRSAVSAALRPHAENQTSRVAPETRKMVQEMAERLGYRTNRYAAVLKSGKTGLIGVLSGAPPYFIRAREKLALISEKLIHEGFIPFQHDVSSYLRRKEETIDILLGSKLEGAILSWDVHPDIVAALQKARIPLVSYEGEVFADVPWLGPDKTQGFHELVQHLIEEGCQNILICRKESHRDYTRRRCPERMLDQLSGYLSAMKMAGKVPPADPLVFLPEESGAGPHVSALFKDYQNGYRLAKASFPRKPDALIFQNDSMALGALCACRDAGLKVPDDICITGSNDEPQALYSMIPITTLGHPITELVKASTELLIEQINGKEGMIPDLSNYPSHLIIRQSSCRRSTPPSVIL